LNHLRVLSNPVLILRRTIVLTQHLVSSYHHCVSGRLVCRSRWNSKSWPVYRTATNTERLYQMLY